MNGISKNAQGSYVDIQSDARELSLITTATISIRFVVTRRS